jgi:hypothetical protein
VLRPHVLPGEFEFEHTRKLRPEVVLGQPAQRKERIRVGERPTPTVEADDALQLGDRFSPDRFAVEARLAQPLQTLAAATPLPFARHRPQR